MGDGLPDLSSPRHVHVANVGGAGMSAVAVCLAEMGHAVTGSDANETPFLARLRSLGVRVEIGADAPSLPDSTEVVVTSTATSGADAVLVAAAERGVPTVHRRVVLGALSAHRRTITVSGTHGKSTTSGLLATILVGAGTGAGYLVGTTVTGYGTNASWGTGPLFVAEGDESDGSFLGFESSGAIVTNVEADHLSFWGTEAALTAGFEEFVAGVRGPVVLCADDPGSARLAAVADRAITYGTDPGADHRIVELRPEGLGVRFVLDHAGQRHGVSVPFAPGVHNARNAAAAIAAAHAFGVPIDEAIAALAGFRGVARRFEARGEAGGVTFVDSYDHLPTEIEAALAAAADGGFRRVVCLFQPHRYTRTRDLWRTFADSFRRADVLGICELYDAGEPPIEGVTGKLVLDAVLDANPHTDAAWLPDLDAAEAWARHRLRPGDLCLTLNAGDLTRLPDRFVVPS